MLVELRQLYVNKVLNLFFLQMHIKHYHPELLKKTSSWAPNVADLAYARTVGDHLDTGSSPTHSSPPVDKTGKSETGSKKAPRGSSSVTSLDARGKVTDKKTSGSFKTIIGSKESKKRDKSKPESEQVRNCCLILSWLCLLLQE